MTSRSLKRAEGRSKLATPQSASCAFLRYGLVPNVCVLPAGDNGSFAIYTFFGRLCGRLHPLPLFTMLATPQPGTMEPEAVRASVCLIMAKEAVALHRLRPDHPNSPFCGFFTTRRGWRTGGRWTGSIYREVARPDFLKGSLRHPDLCLVCVYLATWCQQQE